MILGATFSVLKLELSEGLIIHFMRFCLSQSDNSTLIISFLLPTKQLLTVCDIIHPYIFLISNKYTILVAYSITTKILITIPHNS